MDKHVYISRLGYAALRKGRVSLEGQIYLVTFTTSKRTRLFDNPDLARIACSALSDPRLWQSARLLAWVLMPDHWHGLIELGATGELSRTVQRLKSNTARRLRIENPDFGPVWEKGFHDRAIRSDESLLYLARYVVCNPVRAELVKRVGDYPYWNAVWL
jgi:REP element-mobilizing transposase RayT